MGIDYSKDQKYAIYLEKLRKEYKINRHDFCENICAERTYSRYINGEASITHDKIISFCEKLRISLSDFYMFYYYNINKETQELVDIHLLGEQNRINKAYEKLVELKNTNFSSARNQRYFKYLEIYMKLKLNLIRDTQALEESKILVDYPECLNRNTFDVIDIGALEIIARIQIKSNNETALNKMISILSNPDSNIISSNQVSLFSTMYSQISILLGKLNRIEESYKLADLGINFAKKNHSYISLFYLRYARTCCLLEMNRQEEAEIEAAKCIFTVITFEDNYHIDFLRRVLKKDFNGLDPYKFIENHREKLWDSIDVKNLD